MLSNVNWPLVLIILFVLWFVYEGLRMQGVIGKKEVNPSPKKKKKKRKYIHVEDSNEDSSLFPGPYQNEQENITYIYKNKWFRWGK